MDLKLAGLTALVTGASRGIGFAIAQGLAREGCHLQLAARTSVDLEAARKKILEECDVRVECHALDLAVGGSIAKLAERCAPFGRLAQPDEIGDVVVYLASARASYISGTIVTVDGGRAVRNA